MFRRLVKDAKKEKHSTGVEEIDLFLGGGLSPGTIILLVQGEDVKAHLGIHRLFLSQGLEDGEQTVHISLDNPNLAPPGVQTAQTTPLNAVKETIAWRYKNMSQIGNTPAIKGTSVSRSKKFDLKTVHHEAEKVKHAKIEFAAELETSSLYENLERTRVSISSLFSPLWEKTPKEIAEYLFDLRKIVKNHKMVCLVSIPVYLQEAFNYGYFDYVIGLEANRIPSLKYDGILETIKTDHHKQNKYGVYCTSTGIKVEKIVLPPE